MTRVNIAYTVPVQVVVDLDSATVHRVVVIDEGIAPDRDGHTENADTYRPATADQVAAAYAVAERADEWPGWENGW